MGNVVNTPLLLLFLQTFPGTPGWVELTEKPGHLQTNPTLMRFKQITTRPICKHTRYCTTIAPNMVIIINKCSITPVNPLQEVAAQNKN